MTPPDKDINPRYRIYAALRGLDPDERLRKDEERWPGGGMLGFVLWVDRMRRGFYKRHPKAFLGSSYSLMDHKAWDSFLFSRLRKKRARGISSLRRDIEDTLRQRGVDLH